LNQLQEAKKWKQNKGGRSIKVGTVVMILEDNLPPFNGGWLELKKYIKEVMAKSE
jgi:hypothetical protein